MQSESTVTGRRLRNLALSVFNPDNSSDDDDVVPIQRNTPQTTAQLLPRPLPVPGVAQGSYFSQQPPLQQLQSPYPARPPQPQPSHPIHSASSSTSSVSIPTSLNSQPGLQLLNGTRQASAQLPPTSRYAYASPLNYAGSSWSSRSSPAMDTTPTPTAPSNNLPSVSFAGGFTDDRNLDGLGLGMGAETYYPASSSISHSRPDARKGMYTNNSQNTQTQQPPNPSPAPTSAKVNRREPVERLIITVTADAVNHVIVDINGAKDAADVRERMFSKLCIVEDDQENYQLYRTELGEAALGEPLTDNQLMIYCEAWADAKGTLKFLVQRNAAVPTRTTTMDSDALESCLRGLSHLFIDIARLKEESEYEEKRGGFGYVRVCTLDSGTLKSKLVAAKTIYLRAQCKEPKRLALRLARELKVWAVLQHPHVLPLLGYYLGDDYKVAVLISEYQGYGDLKDYIDQEKPTLDIRLRLIRDSTDGLAYLHGRSPPIRHGDLKAGNVLINAKRQAMLADFGLSKSMETGSTGLTTSKVLMGTLRYYSPELMDDQEGTSRDLPSDIWAWACLALEVLTGEIPYANKKTEKGIIFAIVAGLPPCKIDSISIPSEDVKLLLAKCWSPEPEERPSAISCLHILNLETSVSPRPPSPETDRAPNPHPYPRARPGEHAPSLPAAVDPRIRQIIQKKSPAPLPNQFHSPSIMGIYSPPPDGYVAPQQPTPQSSRVQQLSGNTSGAEATRGSRGRPRLPRSMSDLNQRNALNARDPPPTSQSGDQISTLARKPSILRKNSLLRDRLYGPRRSTSPNHLHPQSPSPPLIRSSSLYSGSSSGNAIPRGVQLHDNPSPFSAAATPPASFMASTEFSDDGSEGSLKPGDRERLLSLADSENDIDGRETGTLKPKANRFSIAQVAVPDERFWDPPPAPSATATPRAIKTSGPKEEAKSTLEPLNPARGPSLTVTISPPVDHGGTPMRKPSTAANLPTSSENSPLPSPYPAFGLTSSSGVNQHASFRLDTWAFRPITVDVLDHLEDFFPDHDLDKPFIDQVQIANEELPSPTGEALPLPAPSPVSRDAKFKHRKSIRFVAEARKKALERVGSAREPPAGAANVERKKSTKLWGINVEEVTPSQVKSATTPESPTGPAPRPTIKWVKGELIGKGTNSSVFLALNVTTGEMMAVKQVKIPQNIKDQNDMRQISVVKALEAEQQTLEKLDHPNIVQYLGFEKTEESFSIFLEYVPGGSIGNSRRLHGKFEENIIKSFTSQIIDGLAYLHANKTIHHDIKADNVLVDPYGSCKISDFATSKQSEENYDNVAITAMTGSRFWKAPEILRNEQKSYNAKIDIWSLGCLFIEMFAGRHPWEEDDLVLVMFKAARNKGAPPVPSDVQLSPEAEDFRLKCFTLDPDERPSAEDLKGHPWLNLPPGWIFPGFH